MKIKTIEVTCKVVGSILIGTAATIGATRSEKSMRELMKKIAPKFVEKMGES